METVNLAANYASKVPSFHYMTNIWQLRTQTRCMQRQRYVFYQENPRRKILAS